MAIDRIGKGAGLPPTPDTQGTGAAAPAGKTGAKFEVERADRTNEIGKAGEAAGTSGAAGASGATGASATAPLARLRAGEIDVHGYIDLKVDEATKGLHGLPSAELTEIKSLLRDQMRTDPGLADLVHAATGKMPTPPED
jgi:hypothetical protein